MLSLKLYMVMIAIILLFAFYQSIYVLISNDSHVVIKIFAFLAFVCVVYIGFYRNTYLPFLGPAVFPLSLLKKPEEFKKGSVETTLFVDAPNGTHVVYWASKPSKTVIEDPFTAYRDYSNAGIAIVQNKQAKAYVDCPSSYKVPGGRTLKPHIHYRVVYPNGMAGSVKTSYIKC
jgi:hypothetical protein